MTRPEIRIRLLGADDAAVLENVTDGVFDQPVRADLAREFLADPRHHLVVALDEGRVVGFASGVHYVHPDKPAELFVAEVGVAATHHRQGIAGRLLDALFERGRAIGCGAAWVATETDNHAARALYASAGGREDPTPCIVYDFDLDLDQAK
jgi:ribosomal protein S18 acetylase RimI-like enzyme